MATREDYINNVNDWSDFISFCYNEGYEDFADNIYCTDSDSMDELINDDLDYYLRDGYGWRDVRESLNDVYDVIGRYDYVSNEGCLYYEGVDDEDFEAYKQDLLEHIDEREEWDEEDDEETYEVVDEEEEEFDDTPIEPEDVSFEELMISSSEIVNNILPIVSDAVDESDILEILR